MAADAGNLHRGVGGGVELPAAEIRAAGEEDVLPNPKDFVHGIQGINFKLVVGILAGDEHFQVIVFVDLGVALGERGPYVGSSAVKPK